MPPRNVFRLSLPVGDAVSVAMSLTGCTNATVTQIDSLDVPHDRSRLARQMLPCHLPVAVCSPDKCLLLGAPV